MSQLLTNHLIQKVSANADLEVLNAQWEMDKRLISNALKSVPLNFPHFSLHDHSHSNTILQQIERFLGIDRINQLTAIDTWLILEAAYLHDIGMVIPFETLKTEWPKAEFQEFISTIANDNGNEFQNFAQYILNPVNSPILSSEVWPLEMRKAVTIFISEYFRRSHAENSRKIIQDPIATIQLQSPRNGLIPERLFSIL
ncbi:HD domain-containing protein, partial [Leptospira idonii]